MKTNLTKTELAVLSALIIVLSQMALSAGPRILLVGDSTVANYNTNSTATRGWGMIIPEFFTTNVTFSNAAVSGSSSKTFITNGYWSNALKFSPDYVFILFGINDASGNTNVGTSPTSETTNSFRNYLRQFVADCVATNAVPILVTTYAARGFVYATNAGVVTTNFYTNNIYKYPDAMKVVAAETNIMPDIPLIDLFTTSTKFYQQIGPAECERFNPTPTDRTHFNEQAARTMARLIVNAIASGTNTHLAALVPYLNLPTAEQSVPAVDALTLTNSTFSCSFTPMEGVQHQLQTSADLSSWTNAGAAFTGYGLPISKGVAVPPGTNSIFTRILVQP